MNFYTARVLAQKYGLESIYNSWHNRKGFYFKGYEQGTPTTYLVDVEGNVYKKEGKHYVLL